MQEGRIVDGQGVMGTCNRAVFVFDVVCDRFQCDGSRFGENGLLLHAELTIDDVIHDTFCNSWNEHFVVTKRYRFGGRKV